jgi:hypothetical protein
VAGTTVKAMNDASKMFLTMQDAITLPMASLSAGVKGLAEWFETNTTSLKDWKNGFLNGNTETNVLEVKDPTVKTDTIDYLDDEQLTNEKNQNITTSQDNNPNKEVSTATPETNETSGSAVTNGEILANRKLQAQMDRLTNYQNASIIANKDKDNEISQEEKDAYEAEVKLMKAIIDNMQKTMRQNEITITANKSNTKATAAN